MPRCPGSVELPLQLREAICIKASTGCKLSELAADLQCPLRTIQDIVRRGNQRGHNENMPRTGRPRKLNQRAIRHTHIIVEHDRRQSLSNITYSLNLGLSSPVTAPTIRSLLKTQFDMSHRVAAKKPFINAKQRKERLKWARERLGWTMEEWKRVIWMDESSVEVGKESRACKVWRRSGERYDKKCVVPTFRSGRTSLMVWGCISYGKRGPLMQIPSNTRNGVDYVNLIMARPLWNFYAEHLEEMGILLVMEDGAPVHRCKYARKFCSQNSMDTIPHPAQSPDLNPIEHVWKQLKILVNERPSRPKNLQELWVALQEEWLKIDISFINALIESMPSRVCEVYNAKGGPMRY